MKLINLNLILFLFTLIGCYGGSESAVASQEVVVYDTVYLKNGDHYIIDTTYSYDTLYQFDTTEIIIDSIVVATTFIIDTVAFDEDDYYVFDTTTVFDTTIYYDTLLVLDTTIVEVDTLYKKEGDQLELNLDGAYVSDWSFISGLTGLKKLSINQANFTNDDMVYLEPLKDLTWLSLANDLYNEEITDFSSLSELTALDTLMLSSVFDLSSLNFKGAPSYFELKYNYSGVVDYTPLLVFLDSGDSLRLSSTTVPTSIVDLLLKKGVTVIGN